MPCSLLAANHSCASLSRFILRTVSFNCLLNEGKSSLIHGCLHLGYLCVFGCRHRQIKTFQDVDMGMKSTQILHNKKKEKIGKAANEGDADMILCSLSKLCPNYILPKAIVQPRFMSANWILLF